ncbi:recombinase family protein [Nocardia sp. CWNU-33]|uniref:recombinase family protein n=1 Tax=Nocardia sp. CWNU-33 TaxID=3392117 RepID=UPI00398E96A8
MVTELDRLGRTLEHLIELSRDLAGREVELVAGPDGHQQRLVQFRAGGELAGGLADLNRAHRAQRRPIADRRAVRG